MTGALTLSGAPSLSLHAATKAYVDSVAGSVGPSSYTVTGDVTGTLDGGTDVLTLASSGVTAGSYKQVTVNLKGIVTGGSNPTTLAGYGITDAQALDADLTAIGALVGTTGFLKKTAANTWTLDTGVYGTGTVINVSIASANGFNGSVETNTTTPAISVGTTITGMLKGNTGAPMPQVIGMCGTLREALWREMTLTYPSIRQLQK